MKLTAQRWAKAVEPPKLRQPRNSSRSASACHSRFSPPRPSTQTDHGPPSKSVGRTTRPGNPEHDRNPQPGGEREVGTGLGTSSLQVRDVVRLEEARIVRQFITPVQRYHPHVPCRRMAESVKRVDARAEASRASPAFSCGAGGDG